MRKFAFAIAVTAVWFLSVATLSAQERTTGSIKGKPVRYVVVEGVRYVALDEAAEAIGLTVSSKEGVVNVEGGGRSVRLMPGKRVAIVDSGFRRFRGPVRSVGGKLCVPEDMLSDLYRVPLAGGRDEPLPPEATTPVGEAPAAATPAAPAAGSIEVALPDEKKRERVTDVTLDVGAESTSLYFDFDRPVEKSIRLKKSEEGKVLTVTLPDTASDPATRVFPVDGPWLDSVKYIRSDEKTVIVRIAGKVPLKMKAYNTGAARLRVSLEPETPLTPVTGNPELALTAEVAAGPAGGLDTVEVDVAELKRGLEGIHAVVAIDPGHGGSDFGVAPEGRPAEKNVNLEIARRLARLLELADQKPFLTRSGDYYLKPAQRVELAASRAPALVVSIHCNASLNEGADAARGVETYWFDAAGEVDAAPAKPSGDAALDAAIRAEAAAILAGGDRKELAGRSRELAEAVDRAVAGRGELVARGSRRADVLFLRECGVPGVHVEAGFLTSPIDARALADPRHADAVADALFRGVRDYLIARKAEAGK